VEPAQNAYAYVVSGLGGATFGTATSAYGKILLTEPEGHIALNLVNDRGAWILDGPPAYELWFPGNPDGWRAPGKHGGSPAAGGPNNTGVIYGPSTGTSQAELAVGLCTNEHCARPADLRVRYEVLVETRQPYLPNAIAPY
jgi:hypothetical protein